MKLPQQIADAWALAKPEIAKAMAEVAHNRIRAAEAHAHIPPWEECALTYQMMMAHSYAETLLPIWPYLEKITFSTLEGLVVMTGRLEMIIMDAEARGEHETVAELRRALKEGMD